MTKDTFTGDLKTAGGGTDGLNGADKLCNSKATAAGLGGTWVAWLSDSTHDAIDRISDVGPWYRLDDIKVFNSKAAIPSGPAVPIDVNEKGLITNFFPWTGTKANGTKSTTFCTDWTVNTGNGECGSSGQSDATWTEANALSCGIGYNLYCFEQ